MKNIISIASGTLLALASMTGYSETANLICGKIPGHWQGIMTFKEASICEGYNGCTHLVTADLTFKSKNQYELTVHRILHSDVKLAVICEDGQLSSPMMPNSTAWVNCDNMNHCMVQFESDKLTAELAKV